MFFLNQIKNCKVNFLLVERYTKISFDSYSLLCAVKKVEPLLTRCGQRSCFHLFHCQKFSRGRARETSLFQKAACLVNYDSFFTIDNYTIDLQCVPTQM